jgi:hypothetical protein
MLLLVSFVVCIGCKKDYTPNPLCISHSNLSLSLNDSLRISNCDIRSFAVTIALDSSIYNPIYSNRLNQQDTVYIHFDSTGVYTLKYFIDLATTVSVDTKQINVN